jgi:hypothetical protein
MIAAVLGAGLQRGQVGTGVGLGVALAPADFAAGDAGQVLALLGFGAVPEQGGAKHGDAETLQRHAAAEPGHFLAQHLGLLARQAGAAVFRGPFGHGPALVGHAAKPLALGLGLEAEPAPAPADVVFVAHRLPHLGRTVLLQPGARRKVSNSSTRVSLCSGAFRWTPLSLARCR